MRKHTSPAMIAMAVLFSATLLKPVSGNTEQTLMPLTLLQSVTAMADANASKANAEATTEEPAYMLEEAGAKVPANPCFETMMAIGCRIQSQIPIWNQFAAQFATTFGISCPAVGPGISN